MLLPEWKSPETRPDLHLAEEIKFFGFPYGLDTSRGQGTVPVPLGEIWHCIGMARV